MIRIPYILVKLGAVLAVLGLIGGCATQPIELQGQANDLPMVLESDKPAPIKFSHLKLLFPPGSDIGVQRAGYFCFKDEGALGRASIREALQEQYVKQAFNSALEGQGYKLIGSEAVMFDALDQDKAADYAIGAKLSALSLELCHKKGAGDFIVGGAGRSEGEARMVIEWSIYDRLKRKVVLNVVTEGFSARKLPQNEALSVLLLDAFEMAALNLSQDKGFYELIVRGISPANNQSIAGAGVVDERYRIFDPQEDVRVELSDSEVKDFNEAVKRYENAVVMIDKGARASGFMITREGHILTSAKNVGDARQVRVIFPMHKGAGRAEVLRVDKRADVALIKLIGSAPIAAPVFRFKDRAINIGDRLYSLALGGRVKSEGLMLNKGIVSAISRNGLIVSDLELDNAERGSMIIDDHGALIGLNISASANAMQDRSISKDLSVIMPVSMAFEVLNIAY